MRAGGVEAAWRGARPTPIALTSSDRLPEEVVLVDLDLDGDDDLIAARIDAGDVPWVENPTFDVVGASCCGPAAPNAICRATPSGSS